MSETQPFAEQVERIRDAWARARQSLDANPAILEGVAPSTNLVQVDEAVETACRWAEKVRAPYGFRPIFPIAKLQLASSLSNLVKSAENIPTDPATHFPRFFTSLMQTYAPVCAATVFAHKDDGKVGVAELTAELAQALGLLNTAQAELAKKKSHLDEASKTADAIVEKGQSVDEVQKQAAGIAEQLKTLADSADEDSGFIDESRKSFDELKQSLDALVEETRTLKERLVKESGEFTKFVAESKTHLESINQECKSKQDLISALLPGATSAGLASAFNRGKQRYVVGQWVWGIGFATAIGMLIAFGFAVEKSLPTAQGAAEVWLFLAHRIPLAAPLVWLGWFCAIQYGNVIRLMEDYAFKEATSLAFAGYRDHMEHLAEVTDEDAATAMEKLALVTISILGTEPLRLLQKQHQDASPLDKLNQFLRKSNAPKTEQEDSAS